MYPSLPIAVQAAHKCPYMHPQRTSTQPIMSLFIFWKFFFAFPQPTHMLSIHTWTRPRSPAPFRWRFLKCSVSAHSKLGNGQFSGRALCGCVYLFALILCVRVYIFLYFNSWRWLGSHAFSHAKCGIEQLFRAT